MKDLDFRIKGLEKFDVHHLGFAVERLDKAVEMWANIYGAGPFHYFSNTMDVVYEGKPYTWHQDDAFGRFGRFAVELSEYHFDEANPLPERLKRILCPRPNGFNHMGYSTTDYDACLERLETLGIKKLIHKVTESKGGTSEVYFYDATQQLGCFLEIFPPSDYIRSFHEELAKEREVWDGKNIFRREMPGGFIW